MVVVAFHVVANFVSEQCWQQARAGLSLGGLWNEQRAFQGWGVVQGGDQWLQIVMEHTHEAALDEVVREHCAGRGCTHGG